MKMGYSTPENIEKILATLPSLPGVYQMKNHMGEIIYVGKSKNLKTRVNSYFARTSELTLAKRQMVGKIADIEVTLCANDVEAIVLETNLIKHNRPKYNILMKDDKNLAYIKITKNPIPEVYKTRQKIRDGSEYYGPFITGVDGSLRFLKKLFKIRNCKMKFARREDGKVVITDKAGRTVPCMDHYIGICPAPCLLDEAHMAAHSQNLEEFRAFIRGDRVSLFADLEVRMREQAKNLEFEEASATKYIIESLKLLHERQKVRDMVGGDFDVIVQYEKYERYFIGLTEVRNAQIVSVFRHELVSELDTTEEERLIDFLSRHYVDTVDTPDSIVLRGALHDDSMEAFLRENKISIEVPQAGPKQELLAFTENQLREYAYKSELAELEIKTHTREHMANILERLGYEAPKHGEIVFECYDISHTNGQFTVASRAVIVNGKPDPSRYRKYNIKTLEKSKIDDFASHREVMRRRTLEGLENHTFPHLIIIDGGKGQLSSALAGIQEGIVNFRNLHIEEVREVHLPYLSAIAKREEEVFIPGEKLPVLFEKGSPELMILQKVRDEAHRFAITANRNARNKAMKKNILEELPGFGPITRKKLLRLSGSTDGLRSLSSEELLTICTKSQIETLRDHGLIE